MVKNFFLKINLNWRAYLAEFLGTFFMVLISLGTVLGDISTGLVGVLGIGFAFAFSYMVMVFATIHISGGHLNPAISLSLWFSKKLKGLDLLFYVFFQFLGGFLAAVFMFLLFGPNFAGAAVFEVLGDISLQKAVLAEALASFVLVFVYFSTLVDRRGPVSFGPFALGAATFALFLFSFPFVGGVINPAQAFGMSVVSNSYSNLLIFLIGPFCGSLFGLVYEWLFVGKMKK